MSVPTRIVLEPAAQEFADAASKPPLIYELDYGAARSVLDEIQAAPVDKLPVDEEWITVPSAGGDARVRLVKPPAADGMLPVIVYMHGGGWGLGNAGTHDRLVRELAVGAEAALAFVEYPNSPEARYPIAIEQGYGTAQWITREGASKGLDAARMAVAGDSVGGDMTAALTLMAKARGDVRFLHASMSTRSPTRRWTPRPTTSSPTGRTSRARRWSGSGGPTRPTGTRARRSPRRPTGPRSSSSGDCRPRSCAWTRRTSCATRARRTPPSSDSRASRSRPSATTAPSTTS